MAILIANIGTSDLCLKIGKYYLPVDSRDEPNIDEAGLSAEEKDVWKRRVKIVANFLEQSQEVNADGKLVNDRGGFEFRTLTERIWKSLESHNTDEKQQIEIKIGRILGAIEEAYREPFHVRKAYFFVTDQEPRQKQDTVYLVKILKKYLQKEFPDLTVIEILVTERNTAVDQDALLEEYYQFFEKLDKNEEILISIKGGTNQMQTAVRVQAIASGIQQQIFLEPCLKVKSVLHGKTSDCRRVCYWRYLQTQKLATVKLLLQERFDFDGSRIIISDWQEALSYFSSRIPDLDISFDRNKLSSIQNDLQFAIDCLNLVRPSTSQEEVIVFLNLYTQCRIYWEFEEIANFLSRISLLYEETLVEIIKSLGGEKYLEKVGRKEQWVVIRGKNDSELDIWNRLEYVSKKHRDKPDARHKLSDRYDKHDFLQALICIDYKEKIADHNKLSTLLDKLNYWCAVRNRLIHGARGMSKEGMNKQLEEDRQNLNNSDDETYKQAVLKACQAEHILTTMAEVCLCANQLLDRKFEYLKKHISHEADAPYYIYSDLVEKVLQQLR